MYLDHGFLVLLVVVGGDGPGRTYKIYDLGILSHFGPLSGVEAVAVSKVDVCTVGEQQFDYFFEAEASCVVERCEPSFVSLSGVGAMIEQQSCDLVVIMFHCVV